MLDFTLITGQNFDELAPAASVAKGAILVLGASVLLFLVLGPVLGWGLGFILRNTTNHNIHVLAFAALGAFVGFSVGEYIGRLDGVAGLGMIAAPAVGIGAAIGRWAISDHAKI
jgi:ABC-type Co2+ transport system permease subunit